MLTILKIQFLCDLAISLLGTYSKRTESRVWERCLHTCVHSSNNHNSQKVEATRCLRQVDK